MGITLSSNGKNIWFTEITGNKLASMDIEQRNFRISYWKGKWPYSSNRKIFICHVFKLTVFGQNVAMALATVGHMITEIAS